MGQIIIDSHAWVSLVEDVATTFAPGSRIPHEWLRRKFGIEEFKDAEIEDYGSIEALIEAVKQAEFDYMSLVEMLRRSLLEGRYGYLANIRGEGYMILPYDEQVTYAFKKFMDTLEKSIRKTDLIMKYTPPVSADQQRKDNDIKARYSWFKQAVEKI